MGLKRKSAKSSEILFMPANKSLIRSTALAVIRNGTSFYEWLRGKRRGDDAYAFLFGGDGSEYYKWCLVNGEEAIKEEKSDTFSIETRPSVRSTDSQQRSQTSAIANESNTAVTKEPQKHPTDHRDASPHRRDSDRRSRSRERGRSTKRDTRRVFRSATDADKAWGSVRSRPKASCDVRQGRMYAWSDDDMSRNNSIQK